MAAWAGRQRGSRFATYAGIGGFPKPRTRQIAHGRSVAQPCGTRAALTAGRGKRESRRDAAVRRGQANDAGALIRVLSNASYSY
jgi:hypothetical protein